MTTIAQQIGRVSANIETSQRAKEFVNLARVVALGRGEHGRVKTIAHDNRILLGPRVEKILDSHHRVYSLPPDLVARQKAAAGAGGVSVSDFSTWGSSLAEYDTLANAFLESLKNYGAFDRMLADGALRRVPFRTRVGMITTGASGATVQAGAMKPIPG